MKRIFSIFTATIIFAVISGIATADNNMFFFSQHTIPNSLSADPFSLSEGSSDTNTSETTGLSRNEKIAMVAAGAGVLAVGGIITAIALHDKKSESPPTSNVLKIADLNAANYDDHEYWDQRLKLIAKAIDDSGASIITLQEIGYNPEKKPNMAEQILKELKAIDPNIFLIY